MSAEKTVRIAVAAHKSAEMPDDGMYLPVQVNAAANSAIPGFQPDDEGDNISALNFRYCELTGLYWIWRNLSDDYIGMCQYRRLFCSPAKRSSKSMDDVLSLAEVRELLGRAPVVLPAKRNYYVQTLAQHFDSYSFSEPGDIETFRQCVGEVDASYLPAFDRVMARRSGHMANMLVMRRDLLDAYCGWLFAVMSLLDERIDQSRTRILGYFAEHGVDIWVEHNNVPFVETGCVFLDSSNEVLKRLGYALRLLGLKDASDRVVGRQK